MHRLERILWRQRPPLQLLSIPIPYHHFMRNPSEPCTEVLVDARAVLLHHASGHQRGDQEVVAVQGIGQHHVAWAKGLQQATHQGQLAAAFALMGPDRRIERRAGGQAHHHDQPRQREANPGCLGAG